MLSNGLTKFMIAAGLMAFVSACASNDTPPPAPEEAPVVEEAPTVEEAPVLSVAELIAQAGDRVFFEFDSSELSPLARRTLRAQADVLRDNPDATVTLEGHCDERGTREYNLALGERRAAAAKNYLVALGISAARVSTISYGKERPVDPASTEEAWAKNRRSATVVN